jgi:hypothetical protein
MHDSGGWRASRRVHCKFDWVRRDWCVNTKNKLNF